MNNRNYRENSKKYDFVDNKGKLITTSANKKYKKDRNSIVEIFQKMKN